MLTEYKLMHKDTPCGVLLIDETLQSVESFANIDKETAPFLGNADTRLMKKWWEARAIPASRASVRELLRQAGYTTTKEYLVKNLALSLTDAYWIQPVEAGLSWDDVNLYHTSLSDGKIPYHNQSSYDPNATLGGQMDKYWDTACTPYAIVKTAYKSYGQQAINEAFATELHRRQGCDVPFVTYRVRSAPDNGLESVCDAFTSEHVEFVPAMEVLDAQKLSNKDSLYDAYIDVCAKYGLEKEVMRSFLDYQTLTDFVINNTDEHLMNFGVLRDADTMRLLSPAPIFDSGNSMYFSDAKNRAMTRIELLEQPVTGMFDREEKMLRRVKNKMIVKTDLLPAPDEVKRFYASYGVPEQKAKVIAQNYETKIGLLSEFQKGKTVSLHHEKQTSHSK